MTDIPNDQEFYRGEVFRVYGNFYNASPEKNYYDYMLVDNHGTFLAVNVSSHTSGKTKAGLILAEFDRKKDVPRFVVTGEIIKKFIGFEGVCWLKQE